MDADSAGPSRMNTPKAYVLFPPREDRPDDPLDTFDEPMKPYRPIPTNYLGWRDAMKAAMVLGNITFSALDAYKGVLQKDKNPDLAAVFREQELWRLNLLKQNLFFQLQSIAWFVKVVGQQPGPYKSTLTDVCRFNEEKSDIPKWIMAQSEEYRSYIVKARAYLVSAHVFYKVNYALCSAMES